MLDRYRARRPLTACRAVIFASMVDDPSECKDEFPTEPEQNAEETMFLETELIREWKPKTNLKMNPDKP